MLLFNFLGENITHRIMCNLSEIDKAWLACLIDSEGSVHIAKTKDKRVKRGYNLVPWISISNTSKELLEHCREIIGAGALNFCPDKRLTSKKGFRLKPRYYFTLSAGYILTFLSQISPYIIAKRRQVEIMSRYLSAFHKAEPYKKRPTRSQKIDVEEFLKLYNAGWTPTKLAKKYNCNKSAITYRLRTLGMNRGRTCCRGEYPQEILDIYAEMKAANVKGQRIEQ